MTRFAEDPTPAILLGLTALSIAGIVYLHTRRTGSLIAILAILLITCLAVVAERVLLTERERIEAVIYGVAEAAEANNMSAVLAWIAPQSSEIRRLVQREMPRCQIERARILSKLSITLDENRSPLSAEVKFQGFLSGQWGRDHVNFGQISDVTVSLKKNNDSWLIIEAHGIDR
ncbi:MAG: hypothetical protein JW829_14155 [Pirellulales bacterium]|nr:hypothetical protein [Pirellulales bacterium]